MLVPASAAIFLCFLSIYILVHSLLLLALDSTSHTDAFTSLLRFSLFSSSSFLWFSSSSAFFISRYILFTMFVIKVLPPPLLFYLRSPSDRLRGTCKF
nr:MAG TPA: hypothetical protein [Caudoviricetes sp.]DAW68922.1 MAG TPA: hypothetical protein [Caudoviricetes sp.]